MAHADEIEASVLRALAPELVRLEPGRPWVQFFRRWLRTVRGLHPLGGSSTGNRLTLFAQGDPAFESMWAAIAAARKRVWLETFIFESDRVGRRTLAELVRAARRGCDVVLLYDHVGSSDVEQSELELLRRAGGAAIAFNPIWPWRRHGPFLWRDHRKILVVDESVAFAGGMNIGADYAGPRHGTERFRDTHLELRGPVVLDLAELFLSALSEVRQAEAFGARSLVSLNPPARPGSSFVQVMESNVLRDRRAIQRALRFALLRAEQCCSLTTPYFLPSGTLKNALLKAAGRGVKVRILTAGKSDVPMVRLASQHIYARFLRAGVRIFEYQPEGPRVLHAKLATIDGVYATVGSFNLDAWSYSRNLEVSVGVLDPSFARELDRQFEVDLSLAREVTLEDLERRSWRQRLLHWACWRLLRW